MNTHYNTSNTLSLFVNDTDKCRQTNDNLRLMLRGWVSSPMVEYEDGGQERLDKFDTLQCVRRLVTAASIGNTDNVQDAISTMVELEDVESATNNLRCIFQGFVGSPLTSELEPVQRANVADTYYEIEQLINELHNG